MENDSENGKKTATIRLYAELNDFVRPNRKQTDFDYSFLVPVTVGEIIESLGIPLSEVDLILIDGDSENFGYRLRGGERISVYPVFESFDIGSLSRLRREPLRSSRFILDAHLGKLAKYLRMFGFDTLYSNSLEDRQIIRIAVAEHRIILTRDKSLLCSKEVNHGYFIRSIWVMEQLKEVLDKFDLYSQIVPLSRCLICNEGLSAIGKEEVKGRIDEEIIRIFDSFYHCPVCDKIYWEGSHYGEMVRFIDRFSRQGMEPGQGQ